MCELDGTPTISTPRLTLRAPRMDDAAAIAALCSDIEIPRMTTHIPWPYGLDEARSFVEKVEAQDRSRDQAFLIEDARLGVVGAVGLHTRDRLPEIGYWVGRKHWGQGYATEAACATLKWARDNWGRKAVFGSHFADNPASAAVLAKTGFLYTGKVELRQSLARPKPAETRIMVWIA